MGQTVRKLPLLIHLVRVRALAPFWLGLGHTRLYFEEFVVEFEVFYA
jgi:hypothetical protein